MISPSTCGPLCQHPGCWKAKVSPPSLEESLDFLPSPRERCEHMIPTLSVSLLEPQKIQRHRSLPPIKTSEGLTHTLSIQKSHSDYQHVHQKESSVPRVSHIIVQAGFQCHAQKRWIWLPSLQSQQPTPIKVFTRAQPPIKDLTDELIQSRPPSSKIMHTRNAQTRLVNSRPKGSSYLDLIRKMGHLNLLDLPHYLQVKLLENTQFRKILSAHPIDNIPYSVLSEGVLLELMRCQLSPQLPANPSLEGVGIFFDPPDDLTSKQEPKCLIMPRRPLDWPEPSTYVPNMHRKIEPSDLPGPMVNRVGKPSFREYVMSKRSSNAPSVIEMPQLVDGISVKSGAEDRSTSHITSVTTFVKGSSITHLSDGADEGGEEGEEEIVSQSLDVVLPADEPVLRIPSAVEDTEDMELIGITSSLPPTRDSWRHTSFSTVTPFSEQHPNSAGMDRERTQMMTPPLESGKSGTVSGNPSAIDVLTLSEPGSPHFNRDPIPPPACTPTNEMTPNPSPTRGLITPSSTPTREVEGEEEEEEAGEEEEEEQEAGEQVMEHDHMVTDQGEREPPADQDHDQILQPET